MRNEVNDIVIVLDSETARSAVVDAVRKHHAPSRSVVRVERRTSDGEWRTVDAAEWRVNPGASPFAPDPTNPYAKFSDAELSSFHGTVAYCVEHPETYADGTRLDESRARLAEITEELSRREDVDKAVELWERLCSLGFVRGETQGYYTHSTCYLTPDTTDQLRNVYRMPDTAELEALVLSDGEETAYPVHDLLTSGGNVYASQDENPWSGDDRLYPITLTLISCGDYHGSDVDAANNRALQGTPGVEVREPNTGGMASVFNVSTTVVGEMTSFANETDPGDEDRDPAERRADALEWLESLVTRMEGLTDYPLLNDETHSELVDELAGEAWDSWLESNVHSELSSMGPGGLDAWDDLLIDMGPELQTMIRAVYYGFEGNDWIVSSLGEGAVNGAHADAVKHVARTVFGWNVP
jgi:hypothetical protein